MTLPRTSTVQHDLALVCWGGRRAGAGRKRHGDRARVPHRARPTVEAAHPLHVTLRLRDGLPGLRRPATRRVLERAFAGGAERHGLRLVHYTILSNHLHFVVEARDGDALARGMTGVMVRVARALNAHWERSGGVFADHFHSRALRTPREVRNGLAYVLNNARRHGLRVKAIDEFSSGPWFDGWSRSQPKPTRASPCAAPRTWLLRTG